MADTDGRKADQGVDGAAEGADGSTGLEVRPRFRTERTGGEPRVDVDLGRVPGRNGGADASVTLHDVDARLLRSGDARFEAALRPGRVTLPLLEGRGLEVDVPAGQRVCGSARFGSTAARVVTGGPYIDRVEIEFQPEIELLNVLEALVRVQHLFEDRLVSTILGIVAQAGIAGTLVGGTSAGALGGLTGHLRRLGSDLKRRVLSGSMEPARVMLSRVVLRQRPEPGPGGPEVEACFSGHVRVLERMTYPFWDIVLPPQVLPRLHASLDRLLSGTPLATGDFRSERFDAEAFGRIVYDLLVQATGEVRLEAALPEVRVHGRTVDRTRFSTRVRLASPVRVAGAFEVRHEGLDCSAALTHLAISTGEGKALACKVSAAGTLDLDTPYLDAARRVEGAVRIDVAKGSSLEGFDVAFDGDHPWKAGGLTLAAEARDLHIEGGFEASMKAGSFEVNPAGRGLTFTSRLAMPRQDAARWTHSTLACAVEEGSIEGAIRPVRGGGWKARASAEARASLSLAADVAPIPEMKIEDGHLEAVATVRVALDGSATLRPADGDRPAAIVPDGKVRARLEEAGASLDGRRLELPAGTEIAAAWRKGEISPSVPDDIAMDVSWDMHGKPCLLHGRQGSASLLTDALRQGELTLHISQGGRFSFSGQRGGLYGVRFFNALLDPSREPQQILDVVRSDEAVSHVVSALEAFNPELAEHSRKVRRFIERVRGYVTAEGIKAIGDFIPRPKIARMLSLVIADSDELEERLIPLIRDVTEGRGLDVAAAKEVLRGRFEDLRIDYELDGILRWLNLVTLPTDLIPEVEPANLPPLVEDPALASVLRDLPTAAWIYRVVESESPAAADLERIADHAPHLTLAQLDTILARARASWPANTLGRLRRVRDAKRKVARVEEGYGGIAFAAQASTIAGFLGDVIGALPGIEEEGADATECALGPRDVAVLLQAGIAEGRQGPQTQINNRFLIELLRARPGDFTLEVLVEMGQQVPRILAGVLFAFLHQDQDELHEPLDLAALLEEKLGVRVPRRDTYMAGGRKVRESYFAALSRLSEKVFDRAGPYLAKRAWLREVHHPAVPGPHPEGDASRLEAEAIRAIETADAAGRRCDFGRKEGADHALARTAYREAFAACAAFLQAEPTGFQLPWFKAFWLRNEEALKALSVVRSYQGDVDDVRHWFAVTAGRARPRTEQDLLEAMVRTLVAYESDQEALLADPLVRLLIDEEPGRYDFTVISAMGVITDGKDGREFEDTYRRLGDQRGVRVIRAHTGLFMPLEYNASAIIRAVRETSTPWGWIGYSQGCANGLQAESFLRGGTPEQQALLSRLVCRNLLFSAANGSAHGTSGAAKYLKAMVEGEQFLKHFQASYSRELVDVVLRGLKSFLDSGTFIKTLGGTFSLSLERAVALHRDGQFAPWVPTSTLRGVITADRQPEALEYLYAIHRLVRPDIDCDTQVAIGDTVGHAVRVRNARTEVLERCDMGSLPQATHHWSPLVAEIEFVTTERDRTRAVYQGPKDRHVFPWIEVNARFGRIRRA